MNDTGHLTLDEIADLHGQLLEPIEAAQVEAHLGDCADCASLLDALDDVSVMLLDAAADSAALPASVAADLDTALDRAQAEREAGISVLADRRESDAAHSFAATRQRPSRWILVGAAAAAAVIAVPVGLGILDNASTGDADSSSADVGQARSALEEDSRVEGGEAAGGAGGASNSGPDGGDSEAKLSPTTSPAPQDLPAKRLNPENVADFALSADSSLEASVPPARCSTYHRLGIANARAALAVPARWRGKRAVVLLDRKASSVSVYDCMNPGELLYETRY